MYFFFLAPVSMFSLEANAASLPPVDVDSLDPVAAAVDSLDFLMLSGLGAGRIGHLEGVEL